MRKLIKSFPNFENLKIANLILLFTKKSSAGEKILAEVVADAAENEPYFAANLTAIDYLNENEFYMQ